MSAVGDSEGARRSAVTTLARTERIVAVEPDNGSALSFLVAALVQLEQAERAKEWMARALVLDPDNSRMRYNFACDLILLGELDAAFDILEPESRKVTRDRLNWWNADRDLDALRGLPRFKAMMAAAEARLA